MALTPKIDDIEVDVDALNRRYRDERDKRKRSDAMGQYQYLHGRFAAFDKDPHADPTFTRDSLFEDVDVLIIGGGFAGLLAGGRLRESGVDSIRIVEKGADFGGTWYWNRYPGAACDVESYIYLPLLEELGYLPSEKYPKGPEIYAHCRRLAVKFDLYPAALFQTQAQRLCWDETASRWIAHTDRGDRIAARFVISCTGLLSAPKLPGIPGIESFKGHAFHTSRWDYKYTGGDEQGNLTGLADKVVGIIGTGSTAIQAVPHLAASAKQLYVFQRTPSSVDVRGNAPTDPAFLKTLKPGWQRERRDNFTTLVSGAYAPVDLVSDSWTDIMRDVMPRLRDGTPVVDRSVLALAEMKKMEVTRKRVDAIVLNKETAEALKPYFHYFCKRPCFHDEYLGAFNEPHVNLVDTNGQGVERITPRGVVVAGREYSLDCLIFATGFDFLADYCREAGLEIIGSSGQSLAEYWSRGPRTLYGICTHGFSNFFFVSFAQAGATVNYVHVADEQTKTIVQVIVHCLRRGIATVQPTKKAEANWVEEVAIGSRGRRAFLDACTPGYYNSEGKREGYSERNDFYAGGPMAYMALLEALREPSETDLMDLAPNTK